MNEIETLTEIKAAYRRARNNTDPAESMARTECDKAIDAIEAAIAALRAQLADQQNAPLTLEELRGMESERVWVQFGDIGMYAMVAYHSDPAGYDGDDVYLTNNLGGRNTYEEIISKGGQIYRRPPEQ